MALNNKDLFLVTIDQDPIYTDKKITFLKLKQELGVGLAVEETTLSNGLVTDGTPGLMYPDGSFDYDRSTGRLSVPLDARGVSYVGLIDSTNVDSLPVGNEKSGDFYICDEADLVISTSKWLGIGDNGGVTAPPNNQVLTVAGSDYHPNNGTVAVTGIKTGVNPDIDTGVINVTFENGRVIQAVHQSTSIDIPSLNLVGGLFEFVGNNTFKNDIDASVEVLAVVTDPNTGEHVINFKIVSQGKGYRDTINGGNLTNALAVPVNGDASSAFNVDLTVDSGSVQTFTNINLGAGHNEDDEFEIALPYNASPSIPAKFTLKLDGEGAATLQINDKLIKRGDGNWDILTDQLANQAVLTILNEEDTNGDDLTPALKIKRTGGDPRYITLAIDEVDSTNPGLMPPGLYDQINSLPDAIAGGTIVDLETNPELAIDVTYTGKDVNPVQVTDIQLTDDQGDPISTELIKNVLVSVNATQILTLGADSTRIRGTVFIANKDEIEAAFARGGSDTGLYIYDRVINAAEAGHHLMPRNLEHLSERAESHKTAKRLRLTTTSYEIQSSSNNFADITAILTYQDGTEVPTDTTYSYHWQGEQYLDNVNKETGDDNATIRVTGDEFKGPTNIICSVTETTDSEFQTLTESIYLHFPDPNIAPPPEEAPIIGNVEIVGPSPVMETDIKDYTVAITGGSSLDNVVNLEIDAVSTATGTISLKDADTNTYEVTFGDEGTLRLKATVTSATASDSPITVSRDIIVDGIYINDVMITGPNPVLTFSEHQYQVTTPNATATDMVASLVVNSNSADKGSIELVDASTNTYKVTFTDQVGQLALNATVTSATAKDDPQTSTYLVNISENPDPPDPDGPPDNLTLIGTWDWVPQKQNGLPNSNSSKGLACIHSYANKVEFDKYDASGQPKTSKLNNHTNTKEHFLHYQIDDGPIRRADYDGNKRRFDYAGSQGSQYGRKYTTLKGRELLGEWIDHTGSLKVYEENT